MALSSILSTSLAIGVNMKTMKNTNKRFVLMLGLWNLGFGIMYAGFLANNLAVQIIGAIWSIGALILFPVV
jgi:hypothetical protein